MTRRARLYIGVVHHDGDAYGVHFPDLPGCFSAADEQENLIAECHEAIALRLEDTDEWPESRALKELRSDPDVARDLSEGAFLIAVPFAGHEGRTRRLNISMDAALVDAMDMLAEQRNLTRSALLADLARKELSGQTG
ncbi:type II toxin-antitoxin system HicB family antitoxin [Minwuia sp.]|uniref:type II toxin-antitoxin system HicB family antitoxin n=1 Tax=Minwuia sp. TaxID=2493630 RepID=UPI003A90B265